MKLITTIIRPDRLPEVKAALFRGGVTGITLSRVVGHGGERDVVQQYRAETVVLEFHEKVRIEIAVSDEVVTKAVGAIVKSAKTGKIGDGKVFIVPLEEAIRIRTDERGDSAV